MNRKINFGWKYFNYILIAVALIVGLGVWFMPNKWAEPTTAANFKETVRLERQMKARKAEEARIKKEQEELGLIYLEPGINPFPTEKPKDE
jgi:hypothetical protein